jgi:hypothetical protein
VARVLKADIIVIVCTPSFAGLAAENAGSVFELRCVGYEVSDERRTGETQLI